MSDLNVARWSNKLRDLLVLRGGGVPAPEVADEIVPIKVIETERLEDFFLGQEQLYGVARSEPAVVGNVARFALFNPVDSGRLVIVERVAFRTAVDMSWQVRVVAGTGGLATTSVPRTRDSRGSWDTGGDGAARLGSDAAGVAGIGTVIAEIAELANRSQWWDMPFVITPTFALEFNTLTVNTVAACTLFFRERAAEKTELQRG